MKNLEKENIPILISALEERYKSIHTIRERVQSIGIWSLGLMFTAGGFLFQGDTIMTITQKSICIIGVIIASYVLRFEYLEDLNKGFKSQQKVAARIEKVLGFFTSGIFDNDKTSIYPEGWENAGKEKGEGRFFSTTYVLLLIGLIFLITSIIFSGCL